MSTNEPAANTPTTPTIKAAGEIPPQVGLRLAACPECGKPAELIGRGHLTSTDGPVEVIRVICVDRHSFLMNADRLAVSDGRVRPRPRQEGPQVTVERPMTVTDQLTAHRAPE
jgi:hypothetical protein